MAWTGLHALIGLGFALGLRRYGIFGDLSTCDKTVVEQAAAHVSEMIRLGVKAFTEREVDLARKLREMDTVLNKIYSDYLRKVAETPEKNASCVVSATLIICYLERIADHATYIGDSVLYIVSGERSARK